MMTKAMKVVTIACGMLVCAGCTQRLTDFTMISTKNVDLSRVSEFKRGPARVQGRDTVLVILFIPTKFQINLKEAIDRAIQSVPGCVALVDGVLYHESGWFVVGGWGSFVIEGTPLIDPKLTASLPSRHIIVAYDKNRDRFVPRYVSEAEFVQVRADALKRPITTSR